MNYCMSCGALNRLENRYCNRCGGRLGELAACSRCSFHNPVGSRYCGYCGQLLEVSEAEQEELPVEEVAVAHEPTVTEETPAWLEPVVAEEAPEVEEAPETQAPAFPEEAVAPMAEQVLEAPTEKELPAWLLSEPEAPAEEEAAVAQAITEVAEAAPSAPLRWEERPQAPAVTVPLGFLEQGIGLSAAMEPAALPGSPKNAPESDLAAKLVVLLQTPPGPWTRLSK
ncbi:MAG: zinc ribbon domain-containing protein [Chloroflexi bacterium]|nr:zinc ribbon domain-containing protein [Chloroflexota bacterium]